MSDSVYYIISGWDDHYENNRTRTMKVMGWTPVPNRFDGDRMSELLDELGAAGYGAWVALLGVAGRCPHRGTLLRDNGKPHNSTSIARMSRLKPQDFENLFPVVIGLGLIEAKPFACNDPAPSCHEGDTLPAPSCQGSDDGMEWNGTERKGIEGNGTESFSLASPEPAKEDSVPEKTQEEPKANPPKPKKKRKRKPDVIWDCVVGIFWPDGIPPTQVTRVGGFVRDLKVFNATPEQIQKANKTAKLRWKYPFGPEALVKHWSSLKEGDEANDLQQRAKDKHGDGNGHSVADHLARVAAGEVQTIPDDGF